MTIKAEIARREGMMLRERMGGVFVSRRSSSIGATRSSAVCWQLGSELQRPNYVFWTVCIHLDPIQSFCPFCAPISSSLADVSCFLHQNYLLWSFHVFGFRNQDHCRLLGYNKLSGLLEMHLGILANIPRYWYL